MSFKSYIKIPRELFSSEEWTSKRKFSRFEAQMDLWQMAAYTDGKVVHCAAKDVLLRRGQLLTTMRSLADRWGWSAATVNRYLRVLRNNRCNSICIIIETTLETGKTLITICNYDDWNLCCGDDETSVETGCETLHETPNETYIELKYNKRENKDKAHTQVFTEKGVVGGNAEELVAWIMRNYPTIARMPEPISEQNAVWMLRKYPLEDIYRLIATMHSKEAHKRNRNAYAAFVNYAKNDRILREQGLEKLYTYEQMCNEVPSRAKQEDFERLVIDGRPMYRKKIN